MKEKLSKRQTYCTTYASKFYRTNMTQDQIYNDLLRLWAEAHGEGYEDNALDRKKLKDCREKLLLRGFNELRDAIDNKIHENK
jgi:hypothetical protein